LTLLLIRPMGPVMLSTIFMMRDNLNTLSRLMDRAHLRSGGRYEAALYPARLLSCVCLASRSFTAEYLGDRAGDDVLFQLLNITGLCNVFQELPDLRFLRVKALQERRRQKAVYLQKSGIDQTAFYLLGPLS